MRLNYWLFLLAIMGASCGNQDATKSVLALMDPEPEIRRESLPPEHLKYENTLQVEQNPLKVILNAHPELHSGRWHLYVTEQKNSIVGGKLIVKDTPANQSEIVLDPSVIQNSKYFFVEFHSAIGRDIYFGEL